MTRLNFVLLKSQKPHIYSTKEFLPITGSAGSGKTIFGAYKTIKYALENPGTLSIVVRKTLPSNRRTCYREIKTILDRDNVFYFEDKSQFYLKFPNGSEIHFMSMDDYQKIRSLTVSYIWLEQGEEVSFLDFVELQMRLRGPGYYRQFLMTFTPELESHWIPRYFERAPGLSLADIVRFDYRDNIFMADTLRQNLENLKLIDEDLWRKYALAEFGQIRNRIFHWKMKSIPRGERYYFGGLDWGYVNPSSFSLLAYQDGNIYIIDEVYVKSMTNPDFLLEVQKCLKENNISHWGFECWADPSRPDNIDEFDTAGFNIKKGEIKPMTRINRTQQYPVYYDERCTAHKSEMLDYKYMVDKEERVLAKPVPYHDHAMDSTTYGVFGFTVERLGISKLSPLAIKGSGSRI